METWFIDQQAFSAAFAFLNSCLQAYPREILALAFVIGCCVGSFLNVLALRSLKEESVIFPASYCPQCRHKLAIWDNIPVLSYIILKGRCRYCRCRISWQYPLVEISCGLIYLGITYVFLLQPIKVANYFVGQDLFAAIQEVHKLIELAKAGQTAVPQFPTLDSPDLGFQKYGLALGAYVFASTLIAVTVTDFKEKLIPHEITYPSMIFGIAFSAIVRADLMGAMAGIGASYIIFDFLAFYGLKLYLKCHPQEDEEEEEENQESDHELDRTFDIGPAAPEEPVEVMGGGDAVLSAVMSAYLGWHGLVLALLIGFLAGTIMGMVLLVVEMARHGLMKECRQKSLLFACGGGAVMGILTFLMMSGVGALQGVECLKLVLNTTALGAAGGALIGVVLVGTKVSKPFPFGPALALGGFVAMFLIPYWLPFY